MNMDILIYIIIALSAMVHGLLGLGFPLLATPLLTLGSDVRTAVVMLLMPTLAINVVNVIRGGHWRQSIGRYWPLALFGAVGSLLGTQLLVVTDPAPYKILMAAMILFYLNIKRLGIRLKWVRKNVIWASILFGFIGGVLAGTVNVMVPALIIFALEMKMPPLVTVQVFNFSFLIGKLSQGAILASHGYLNSPNITSSIPLIGVALVALFLGIRYRGRIKKEVYQMWLRWILGGIAILLSLQYMRTLL